MQIKMVQEDYQMFWSGAVIATTVVAYYLFTNARRKSKKFPPGPTGLPLIGYAPFMGENPGECFTDLSKKYGAIFSVNLGTRTWVVFNDYDIIQKTLVKESQLFSGRPRIHTFEKICEGLGIVFIDYGDLWKSQRKFGHKTLRSSGMNRRNMEPLIVEETRYLCEAIQSQGEDSFYCQGLVSYAVANIILRLAAGLRYSYDDRIFIEIIRIVNQSITDRLDGALFGVMTFVPFTRFLPVFWSSYNRFYRNFEILHGIFQGIIEEHEKELDVNITRDFIDEYLKEMRDGNDKMFHKKQLLQFFQDLVIAGTETTSSTLRWCILGLAHFPHCQEKIAEEIDETIGESGIVSMSHRDKMMYTCAYIQEIMRHRTLIPLNLPHRTSVDVDVCGFRLPRDTPIMSNLWAIHHDPLHFDNPEEFKPERFLDDDHRFIPNDHVIPFSVGPRACLGESLARMEIFLFFVGIVQKFRILRDPEKPLPSFDKGVFGVVYGPHEFHVVFENR